MRDSESSVVRRSSLPVIACALAGVLAAGAAPAGSGSGRTFAFASNRSGNFEIYSAVVPSVPTVSPVPGLSPVALTQLTNNPFSDREPAWSPDGSKIAFVSNRSGHNNIYFMNADGSGVTSCNDPTSNDHQPAWSRNGSTIAFASNRSGGGQHWQIYVVKPDCGGVRRLTNNSGIDDDPAWSPDGRKIAYTHWDVTNPGDAEILVMNADGSGVHRLTGVTRGSARPTATSSYMPAWSPDGRKIVFVSNRAGNPEIYVMNSDGTGVLRLTNNPAEDGHPAWSPDGRLIAFYSDRATPGRAHIYVMSPTGSHVTPLISSSAVDADLAWRPS